MTVGVGLRLPCCATRASVGSALQDLTRSRLHTCNDILPLKSLPKSPGRISMHHGHKALLVCGFVQVCPICSHEVTQPGRKAEAVLGPVLDTANK